MMRVTDRKDKAREKEVAKDRETLKLRGEREEAMLKAGRLEREKERGGMEGQVLGWKQRALKAEEKAERQLKKSKERERELQRATREAKAKQHGFVQQLQDRMEIGGTQMYCVERGNEGMFMPKNQMHVQLRAWEEEVARKRKELEEKDKKLEGASGKLLAVVGDLLSEKSDHSQMQLHAVALERTVKSLSMRNKVDVQELEGKIRKEQKKVAKAEALHSTEISSYESRVEKCEGDVSDANAAVANAKAAHATLLLDLERASLSLQASTDAASAKERQLRAINDSRVRDLEKFRLSTARLKEQKSKEHTKDWSKVPTHKHPEWFQNKMAVMEEQILQLMELEDDHKTAVEVNKASADDKPDALLEILGRPGDRHSLEAVELGMEVMSHGMSAQTARDTIRSFMNRIYPKLKEGTDYRVPGTTMLKRWRRLLEPVCHFISLSALDKADIIHLLSDACTKRHVGVFYVDARTEVKTEGGVDVQNLPLKFKVTRDGTGACEAEAAFDAFDTKFAGLKAMLGDPEDRFLRVVSSSSDNAPNAKLVSTILKEKKHRIFNFL
jgi:hypothetical protein